MIEAKQVRYGIRSREILRGVDFRVEKGEFVGLIGPNGSGKSTFLKNVYKVLRPQAGELTLMGDDLLAMSNREMAQRLAVMVQEQEAAFDFTVEEVVMMGRQARKRLLETDSREDRALVGEILARTGLASLREQGFSTLSGGEKQRVLIARALAQQTAVLVLDEPTNHLDIKYQLQLMELVRGSGCTVVAAIHDLNLAAAYCHRLYALKDGVIVGEGAPKELLTPAFLREVYEVEAEVRAYAEENLRGSMGGYDSVRVKDQSVEIRNASWKYALLPVWVMTYRDRKKDKLYYFAMNGQTGKINGELPVDKGKLAALFGAVFVPVFLFLLAGGWLI